jgi:hypothetical protein
LVQKESENREKTLHPNLPLLVPYSNPHCYLLFLSNPLLFKP